jgi:hypothetical protein
MTFCKASKLHREYGWHYGPAACLNDAAQVKKVYLLARGKKQLTAAQRVDKVYTQQLLQQPACCSIRKRYNVWCLWCCAYHTVPVTGSKRYS